MRYARDPSVNKNARAESEMLRCRLLLFPMNEDPTASTFNNGTIDPQAASTPSIALRASLLDRSTWRAGRSNPAAIEKGPGWIDVAYLTIQRTASNASGLRQTAHVHSSEQ